MIIQLNLVPDHYRRSAGRGCHLENRLRRVYRLHHNRTQEQAATIKRILIIGFIVTEFSYARNTPAIRPRADLMIDMIIFSVTAA